MAKVKLSQVGNKALREKAFFKALLKDAEKALASANYELSPGDLAKLKRSLSAPPSKVTFDFPTFVKAIHAKSFDSTDWSDFLGDWSDKDAQSKY